ncbi:L,D-transpeptidase [Jannaschia sp. R86511]|uniref:L,D-transpeptidase n=1 Tax=Jannaschia sp. R86511 TaxID=3093853 RepID=UPI0036D3DD37
MRTPLALVLAGALASTLALTACGSDRAAAPAPVPAVAVASPAGTSGPPAGPTTPGTTGAPATTGAPGASDAAEQPAHAVAVATTAVTVHPSPDGTTPGLEVPAETSYGSRRTFRVLQASPDGRWLQVVVPVRADTRQGWVRADDVSIEAVRHHIAVDLSERTLVLSEDGVPVLTVTVAVGSPENPTPTGRFAVTDKLRAPDGGVYGPYAFGLSAWSPTLTEFAGGDGQIGLHGTDRPDLLGQAVSHGCIRVPDDVVRELASVLPLGVPVDIRA